MAHLITKTSLQTIRAKVFIALLLPLVWLFATALRQRGKYYTRIIALSEALCFLEIWRKITRDKPVDQVSPLYKEISDATDYYLSISSSSRQIIPTLEREILRYNFIKWLLRDKHSGKEKQYRDFVRENNLIAIIRKHINLRNYINYRATKELAPFEATTKEALSATYWETKFSIERLPLPLQTQRRPRFILSYLKKTVRNAKREIASNNYLKIDFSTSELTALITLSGAILLLLGYCRVALVNWWLGVPYERYYAISDYIASSVNSISQYLVAATATAIFWGIYLATINAYSLQSASAEARTLHGRIQSWALHFVGISSVLALIVVYLSDRKIDAISFEVVVAYIGMPLIGHASARFFSAPYRAFLFLALFFSAFVTGLAGVITEIQRITAPNSGYPTRVLNFTNVQYNEPEWAVIGITSSFAILRRRADGIVQVQAKSELKRVDDLPAKPVGRISP